MVFLISGKSHTTTASSSAFFLSLLLFLLIHDAGGGGGGESVYYLFSWELLRTRAPKVGGAECRGPVEHMGELRCWNRAGGIKGFGQKLGAPQDDPGESGALKVM